MVNYPIRVDRHSYRGNDARKMAKSQAYNQDAAMLERIVNEMIAEQGPGVYHYYTIADRSGLSVERVGEILFCVDCGSNGFTVNRGKDGPSLMERMRSEPSDEGTPHPRE